LQPECAFKTLESREWKPGIQIHMHEGSAVLRFALLGDMLVITQGNLARNPAIIDPQGRIGAEQCHGQE
jgi:hypothetical protein